MSDEVKSKIAELEKELYSKDFKTHRVLDILPQKEEVPAPSWSKEETDELMRKEESAALKHHILMKKFVQFSIGFFAVAVLVALFIWWRGSNIVSGENILIDIAAPVAVSGGESFETKLTISNNNKVSIESATLFVEYPVGFYSVSNKAELPRASKDLGMILSGQSVTEKIDTLLYGEENTSKEVKVVLEYRMAGSNATLKKITTYSTRIASSPVNIKLSVPEEIGSGQAVEFTIDVASNSKDPIDALVVNAVYPFGFNFQSATPAPMSGDNVWKIPGLATQEKRTIKIRGVIEGQEGEEKITRISVGTENPKDERLIGIVYNATTESSLVKKPSLALDIAINNNKSPITVSQLGKSVRVDIAWQSNNPTKITDATIEVKIKGDALDKYSLYASSGGFYRSIDNTIVWNKSTTPEFSSIEPGMRGSVSFSFAPVALGVDATRLIKNPQVIFDIRASALGLEGTTPVGGIATFLTRSVRFETDMRLSAKGLYFSGPIRNVGPIPPRVDNKTTYTVSLGARSSINNISNVQVKTTLPIYVEWLGVVYPEGEDVTFNENTREVVWNAGRVPSGGSREASFQISLLPSISHVNRSPALTGDLSLVATDDFTKTEVSDNRSYLTTHLSSDPLFPINGASVVD